MEITLKYERDYKLTPTQQVFVDRGIPLEEIEHYLNTTDDDINSWKDLKNMQLAVETYLKHIDNKSKILIQVDSDVDGFTSAALLYNFTKENFPEADLSYQVHENKAHGLEVTDDILQNKYDLVIVPDAGSNEYEIHAELKELNIDCIVLDHHDCDKESEDAIIVNNQLSPDYENKALSGVGVVWQFCRAIGDLAADPIVVHADHYLDLVSLGLVADMMDLRSFETRRLIDKGLEIMNDGNKPFQNTFLAEFVIKQSYSLGSSVTPIGMAFYIAPFINSTVRVGTLEERIGLFEAMLEEKANEMVPSTKRGAKGEMEKFSIEAARIATNVKNRQKREEDKGAIAFAEHVNEEYLNKNSIIVLDTGGTVVKDLNGLIANQMQSKFQRPALVISRKDGFVSGSGRGYESNVMTDFRQFINESGLAEYAEGHAQAFGVKFTEENFQQFIEYANANLDYAGAFKEYEADFIMEGPEIDSELVLELAKLKNFWGKGMEEPLIAFRNVPISTSDKFAMANNTLKLMAKDVPCIKFRAGEGAFEELAPNEYTISLVDIVGKTNLNEFNGRTSGQIFVTEYEIVDTKMNF